MKSAPHPFRDELDDAVVPILRTKTPAEKVAMIGAADRTARILEAAGFRLRHPDWTEDQIQRAIVHRRIHGSN